MAKTSYLSWRYFVVVVALVDDEVGGDDRLAEQVVSLVFNVFDHLLNQEFLSECVQ